MRYGRNLLISIFIIAILVSSSLAAIRTVTYPSNIPESMMGWDGNHPLPYFDPAKGELLSVLFTATLNDSFDGKAENKNTVSGVSGCYMNVPADLSVVMINGDFINLSANLRVPKTGTVSVTKHTTEIGEPHYTGPDSFNGTDQGNTSGFILYNTPSEVSNYIGTGTFNLSAHASASATLGGGGNFWFDYNTYGWSNGSITYTYNSVVYSHH
jgi:hypothetical protein